MKSSNLVKGAIIAIFFAIFFLGFAVWGISFIFTFVCVLCLFAWLWLEYVVPSEYYEYLQLQQATKNKK